MTDERIDSSNEPVIAEAVTVIDGALAKMMQRELVSSGEVADLLLDVRTLLTAMRTSARSLEIAETAFAGIEERLERVLRTDLPALRAQLDAQGVPWTPGRGIPGSD